MNINDVILNNELTVGEDCYYDQGKYTYGGINEEGKHILLQKNKDGEVTKSVTNTPHVPKLPLGLYFKNKRTGKYAELTKYTQMLGDMYYELKIYDDVFKGYDLEKLIKLEKDWVLLEKSPFLEENDLIEKVNQLNNEIGKYKKQIEEIKNTYIKPLAEKRKELFKQCKHDWYKYDEVETRKGRFEQECVCNICGEEKMNYYSRLF
ncbi:hypothetical protein KDN24_06780 [Bacillus sp. Bva_UNVM-123]|uniref:hypothetical protein n=1 Tax=Bacillus sp. Bva_UNVM-123 TaxID=2829798 RepID=UPI00391F009F